jgi:hypothetical protein
MALNDSESETIARRGLYKYLHAAIFIIVTSVIGEMLSIGG